MKKIKKVGRHFWYLKKYTLPLDTTLSFQLEAAAIFSAPGTRAEWELLLSSNLSERKKTLLMGTCQATSARREKTRLRFEFRPVVIPAGR